MSMTYGDAITAVVTEGGFDSSRTSTSRAVIGRWVNAANKEMMRKAKVLRESLELGPTTSAAAYAVPANVLEIDQVTVGGTPYRPKGRRQLNNLVGGIDRILYGVVQGFFVPTYDSAGGPFVTLYPTPLTAGLSVTADAVLNPPTLSDEANDVLLQSWIPDDFVEAVIDKAISIGLTRIDSNPFIAQSGDQEFDAKTEELRRLVSSRVGGTSATQLRVTT